MKKITKEQAKAFAQVIKAMERAKSKGLRFFGKQWSLVAYNESTAAYEDEHGLLNRHDCRGSNNLEYLSEHILNDSGADDYARYLKDADDPYKGAYQETPIWQDYM